ncbi:MAG: T9SS type A sorting domain-containing protein [Bacteroidetes bacterium]|nr:T9SS type A sorting domain-containing protein [Bacteroidota bacterium]
MKKQYFVVLLITLFASTVLTAQSYSVWFNSPTNNSTVSGSVLDNTKSSISISFSWSGQKANPQNKWKFWVIKDILTSGGQSYAETWVYEDTPYCTLPGDVLQSNWYKIVMYEEDYVTKALAQRAETSHITVGVQQTVFVENNFSSGNVTVNSSAYSSGSSFNLSSGQNLSLVAIENQTDGQGYTRIWNTSGTNNSDWKVNNTSKTFSNNYTYYASSNENGAIITAGLRKICNITFSGPVYSGNAYYNNGVVSVVEGNPVQVTATSRVSNDYMYQTFASWADNGSTQNPRSFTTYDNASFGINYNNVNPDNGYRHLTINTTVGQPVQLNWSEHPNTGVTEYRIFRMVRPAGGTTGPETLIATVNRGTLTYTDNSYQVSDLFYYQVFYDVRAYYAPTGLTSDPDFISTFANTDRSPSMVDNSSIQQTQVKEIPDGYAVTNYPNPFNPTTTINYQLPENGFVTIKVYDVLGKEVATLVNENKSAGYYNVNFDASKLTSGVYIYTISANGFIQSKKMLLMK